MHRTLQVLARDKAETTVKSILDIVKTFISVKNKTRAEDFNYNFITKEKAQINFSKLAIYKKDEDGLEYKYKVANQLIQIMDNRILSVEFVEVIKSMFKLECNAIKADLIKTKKTDSEINETRELSIGNNLYKKALSKFIIKFLKFYMEWDKLKYKGKRSKCTITFLVNILEACFNTKQKFKEKFKEKVEKIYNNILNDESFLKTQFESIYDNE